MEIKYTARVEYTTGHRVQFVDPREQMSLSTTTGNEEDTAE